MSMTRKEALNELLTMLARYSFDADEAQAIGKAMEALRPVSRGRIEKGWPGCHECSGCKLCIWNETKKCNDCKNRNSFRPLSDFCPRCGKPLTDEAVEIMIERLNGIK